MKLRPGLSQALISLQYRDFRLLFLSQVASGLGGQMLNLSNFWQVYALTGSAVHLGLTGIARAIPVLLFSLIGGVAADRFDRRKLIILTQSANGATALTLAALTLSGLIQVWHIYVAVFINGTVVSAAGPARRAVLVSVVPRRHLLNAMSLNALVNQMDKIVAPAVGGVLIALVGTSLTYTINGVGHLVTAATLMFVSANLVPQRRPASPLRDFLEGLAFVRWRSIVLVIILMDFTANVAGNFQILLPILAQKFEVGAVGYGLLSSAPAVGSFLAATALLSLGDFRYKGYLIGGALLAYGACLALLGLAPWFGLALAAAAGLGLTDALQQITRNTTIQMLTPDELRGRVTSFQHLLVNGGPSVGQGVLGALASAVGAPMALVIGGIICAGGNLGILLWRRDLRDPNLGAPVEGLRGPASASAVESARTRAAEPARS